MCEKLAHYQFGDTQYLVPSMAVSQFVFAESENQRRAIASITIEAGVVVKNRYGMKGE